MRGHNIRFKGVLCKISPKLFFLPLLIRSTGNHHQVMVTSYVCSRKAPCPMDVNAWSGALLHQDVINLVVVFPIWAVPCPFSGWFVRAKDVCQLLKAF